MISAAKDMSAATAALTGALLAGATAAGVLPWYVPFAAILVALAAFRRPWTVLTLLVFLLGLGGFQLRKALSPRPEAGARDFRTRAILVLDDARSNFDDERCAAALNLLRDAHLAARLTDYLVFGPAGRDGAKGTDDDISDPFAELAVRLGKGGE